MLPSADLFCIPHSLCPVLKSEPRLLILIEALKFPGWSCLTFGHFGGFICGLSITYSYSIVCIILGFKMYSSSKRSEICPSQPLSAWEWSFCMTYFLHSVPSDSFWLLLYRATAVRGQLISSLAGRWQFGPSQFNKSFSFESHPTKAPCQNRKPESKLLAHNT